MFLGCVLTGVGSFSSIISLLRYVKGKENKDGSVHAMKFCRSKDKVQHIV